ncbi:cationic amino acid transporter 2-like [Oppia nitens]|uniref:cationic amino acid transporter 2-like n=1 Tax=Oppia nitens TaxID=1686743 RepID=UPI0023DBF098|nr:cationic amino acid transporter 2-like [Oppia nitens]
MLDNMLDNYDKRTVGDLWRQLFNLDHLTQPTPFTSRFSNYLIVTISILIIILDALLVFLEDYIFVANIGALIGVIVTLLLTIVVMFCLSLQPKIPESQNFEVPWIPTVPFLSVFVNVYLMFKLTSQTWIRFGVWMAIGLSIYIFYGIRNSNERKKSLIKSLDSRLSVSSGSGVSNGYTNNNNNNVVTTVVPT